MCHICNWIGAWVTDKFISNSNPVARCK
ncbi:hypothetical protein LINPERPRIM_LOCUS2627 [Linum perenne]